MHCGQTSVVGSVGGFQMVARRTSSLHLSGFFNWAIGIDLVERSPFKKHGITAIRLDSRVEKGRDRRLIGDEEERLLRHAASHLHACIVATLETGMRRGETLGIQWCNVQFAVDEKGNQKAIAITLSAAITKTNESRTIPVGTALSRAGDASTRCEGGAAPLYCLCFRK